MSMRLAKKVTIFGIFALLEVLFLSWAIAPNLPHRSADLRAFAKYQSAPTDQNKDIWLKEQQSTQNEMKLRRYLGSTLAFGNIFVVVWLVRRRAQ
jgi:hypothetical protein